MYEGSDTWLEAPLGKLFYEVFQIGENDRAERGALNALPGLFLLAVTSDRVYVLGFRQTRKKVEVKDKVADFDRETVSFSTELGDSGEVGVLELTEEGQTSRIKVTRDALNAKKNPWAAEVIAALSE